MFLKYNKLNQRLYVVIKSQAEEATRRRNGGKEKLKLQNGVRSLRPTHPVRFLKSQLSYLTQGLIYHSRSLLKLNVE